MTRSETDALGAELAEKLAVSRLKQIRADNPHDEAMRVSLAEDLIADFLCDVGYGALVHAWDECI